MADTSGLGPGGGPSRHEPADEWPADDAEIDELSGTDGLHVLLDAEDQGFHLTYPDDPDSGITMDDNAGYVTPDIDVDPLAEPCDTTSESEVPY